MSETKGEKVVTKELNYSLKESVHPTYKFYRVLTQNGSQSVTLSNTGTAESLFELPTKVFNLAKSVLKFKLTVAAPGALTYSWTWADNLAPIFGIQVYTRGGQYLMDMSQNLPHWIQVSRKLETKMDTYQTYEITDGLAKSNTLTSTNGNIRANNTSPDVNYTENGYLYTAAVNTAATIYYEFSLDAFKDTICALDKDVTFPEILYFRVIWAPGQRISFTSDSATNPASNSATWSGTAHSISNLELMLSIEQNEKIAAQVVQTMKGSGLHIMVPYLYGNKTSLNGTSQSLSSRFNSGHGQTLLKAISIPYGAEEKNTFYDHTNVSAAKVSSFYTQLNNGRIQEFNVDCSANVDYDYMCMKKFLRGSVYQSKDMYKYGWFWLDSFENDTNPSEEQNVDDSNLVSGLPLSSEVKYDLYATTVSGTYYWHTFFVCQRMLSIKSDGVSIK
jgi:hypothetical protein